ncbi:hypothetical protein KKE28_03135, partial [Patescibacteria group bacterium]|nr:hypothetical protein [Patescibacteria group bacterium]
MAHFSKKTSGTTQPGCNRLPLRGLTQTDRLRLLRSAGALNGNAEQGFVLMDSMTLLQAGDLLTECVENRVGAIPIPLGLATNVRVNGKDRLVTMATEESTVVAGVSKAAKLCWPAGFTVSSDSQNRAMAQVLFAGFASQKELESAQARLKDDLTGALIKTWRSLNRRYRLGLGEPTAQYQILDKVGGRPAIVVTAAIDTAELAGRDVATLFAEKLARLLEPVVGRHSTAATCSHVATGWTVRARAVWPKNMIGQSAVDVILELQDWANADRRRAQTHNKEILN